MSAGTYWIINGLVKASVTFARSMKRIGIRAY